MSKTIGCIGCGNMGNALLSGFSLKLPKEEFTLLCHDRNSLKMDNLKRCGVTAVANVKELAEKSDIIILAVKPHDIPFVLEQLGNPGENKIIVSLAAGFGLSQLRNLLGSKPMILRCMPTTTAKIGKGVFALAFDPLSQTDELKNSMLNLFGNLGYCIVLPENRFTAFSAFIGAGPAYVFEMMFAMLQGGLTLGFPIHQSRQMLIELFEGAALMAGQCTTSFIELRNEVCSPGGLTIAGINRMDRAGFVGLMVEAIEAAAKRGKEMESEN